MNTDKDEQICAFCEWASPIYDDSLMLCKTKGIVDRRYKCRKFSYDPLKRRPPQPKSAPALEYVDIEDI